MARPKKTVHTSQIRVADPVAEWLKRISDAEQIDVAEIVTPILQKSLFDRYKKALETIAARTAAELKGLK